MYYMNTSENVDQVLVKTKLPTTANVAKVLTIVEPDKTYGRLGQEYTVSVWVYINAYGTSPTIPYQGILALLDNPQKTSASDTNVNDALLTIGLHPTKPQMIIRTGKYKGDNSRKPFTQFNYIEAEAAGQTTSSNDGVFGFSEVASTLNSNTPVVDDANTQCDVVDVDLQRWINVTVSVNGRIMDVYMDGKLARSCIMSNVQEIAINKAQKVVLLPVNPFSGYISGLTVSNYALTPDVIYGRYQAGPYFGTGFLDYLVDKLGVRISYTTTDGTEEYNILRDLFGIRA
jgi:hypothetical protein